jgi:hypothetical protein
MQQPVEFIHSVNLFALFPRHSLAVFADVLTMPAPAELFVGAGSPADATKMAHGKRLAFTRTTSSLGLEPC